MIKAQRKRIVSILFLSCFIVSTMLVAVDKPALASFPEDDLTGLIQQVEALVAAGSINPGNGNALIAKLSAAQRSLTRGRINAAVNQLEDFNDQVGDFVQIGKLSPDEGGLLIDEAAYIQSAVQCTDPLGCVTYRVGEPIRLGSAFVISGPIGFLGVDSQRGVEIALDLQTDLFGHPLELRAEDSQCSPEGGTAAANALVTDPQVAAIVGTTCSGAAFTATPIVSEAGYVMVSPSNTAPSLTRPDTHEAGYLRTAFNDRDQAVVMAELLRDLGKSTSAVIVTNDSYPQELGNAFVETFTAAGGVNLAYEIAPSNDPSSIAAALDAIASAGPPDVLYLQVLQLEVGYYVVTQVRARPEFDGTLLASSDSLANYDFLLAAGQAAEGLLVTTPDLDFSDSEIYTNVLLPAYEAAYGEPPFSPFHASAFDAANMILAGIETAAIENDGVVQVGRQALRDALYATQNFAGATGVINCDPFGDCGAIEMLVLTVEGGEFVQFWP